MRGLRSIAAALLVLALTLGLAVQAAQARGMGDMMAMASMDGAASQDCPDCDDMAKDMANVAACQGGVCVSVTPAVLPTAPRPLPVPSASFASSPPALSAGLAAPPDPYPPRSVLFT